MWIIIPALGLALSTVAWFFGDAHWLLDLFAHFKVHIAVAAAVVACAGVFARRRAVGALCAIIAVLNITSVASALESQGDALPVSPDLQIYSHNIYSFQDDMVSAFEQAASSGSDIVVFLEHTSRWADVGDRILNDFAFQVTAPEWHKPNEYKHGVKVFSSQQILDVKMLTSDDKHLRTFGIRFKVQRSGKPVVVYALHLTKRLTAEEKQLRANELGILKEALLQEEKGTPIIIMGDLNTTPYADAYRELLPDQMVFRRPAGGITATWPAQLGLFGIPIDHVLVSGNIDVRLSVGGAAGSDHRSIQARFNLKAPEPR